MRYITRVISRSNRGISSFGILVTIGVILGVLIDLWFQGNLDYLTALCCFVITCLLSGFLWDKAHGAKTVFYRQAAINKPLVAVAACLIGILSAVLFGMLLSYGIRDVITVWSNLIAEVFPLQ